MRAGTVFGTGRVETVYLIVDDVGCSTWSVCAGGEVRRDIRLDIAIICYMNSIVRKGQRACEC